MMENTKLHKPIVALGVLALFFLFSPYSFASKSDQAREVLRKASGVVAASKGFERSGAIQDLVIAQSRLGDWAGAMQTVELEDSPRGKNQLLYWVGSAKARRGDFEGTFEMVKTHPQIWNRNELLNGAASAAAKQGHFERAFSIAGQIPIENAHWFFAHGWIAQAQMKKGSIQGALETAGKVAKENAYEWGSVFREYAMFGDLTEVVKKSKDITEYWEQGYAQLGIVWGRLKIDDIDGAITTAEIIEWIHPRGLAFVDIAKKQIKKGLLDDARKNLRKALTAILKMGPGWLRADALWQIATVQAEANDIHRARLIASEIEPGGHRDSALRDIALVQIENGDYAGALQTAEGFQNFAFPNPFYLIIQKQILNGDLDGAMSTAQKVPEKFRIGVLAQVALYKAKPGEMQDILKSLSAFSDEKKEDLILMIIEGQAQSRHYGRAIATIAEIADPALRQQALEEVVRVQIEHQEWELAKVTVARSGNVRIYQELALASSQSGKRAETLHWVENLTNLFARTYGLIGIANSWEDSVKKIDSLVENPSK